MLTKKELEELEKRIEELEQVLYAVVKSTYREDCPIVASSVIKFEERMEKENLFWSGIKGKK